MKYHISLMSAVLFAALAVPAFAEGSSDTQVMLAAMESLKHQVESMQKTIEEQNRRIQQLESSRVLEKAQPDAKLDLKDNIGEAVPWLKGLKQSGDLRLRAENFNYFDDEDITSDTRDRSRYRFRLRWGIEKDFADDWKAGFRLVSTTAGANGVATDSSGTNVTLGNPGYFAYKNIFIDRAYATYSPSSLKDYGALKGVSVGAGKFDNPFMRYSTGIVWDGDVTPEGLYEKATLQHLSTEKNKIQSYWTLGQFLSHENAGAETDAQVYGYQAALSWSTHNFGTESPVEISSAISYYDYPNYSQTIGSTNNISTSLLRTNTTALDNPKVLDFYNEQSFKIGKWPVTIWEDIVTNEGNFDPLLTPVHEAHRDDFAWGAGVKIGKMKDKNDWEFHWGWYDIGANAVVAAFNDSDFGGPGGIGFTNRVGQKFGLGVMLTPNVSLNYTGYIVAVNDPTNSSAVAANAGNEKVFRSQADLSYKF